MKERWITMKKDLKNLTLEEKKQLVKEYEGKCIHTIWGKVLVKGFDDEEEYVILYEEEGDGAPFSLTIDDFIGELQEYNS
jgi:hypothetical protein